MPDQRTRITMIVVGAAAFAVSGIGYVVASHSRSTPIVISGPPSDPPPPISGTATAPVSSAATSPTSVTPTQTSAQPAATDASPTELAVDVSGAVRHPTMYYLPAGSRVQQAIHAAGGPASDADLDQVNLAEKVTDGEKVFIPRKSSSGEEKIFVPSASSSSEEKVFVPSTSSSGGATVSEVGAGNTIGETMPSVMPSEATPADAGKGRGHRHGNSKLTSPSEGQIDLNSATAEDLERIPGIGPAMAGRILAYRQQVGSFHSLDDLRQVTGVGDKKLARWSPYLVIH